MSFWKAMGRMIAGQPVYQQTDKPVESARDEDAKNWQEGILPDDSDHVQPGDDVTQDVKPQDTAPFTTQNGQKIIPEIRVGRCETHLSGDNIELWIVIKNTSEVEIMLDKIVMLGRTTELDRFMKPSEDREFMVYRGPKLKNGSYTKAQIMYKLVATGDYFCADQEVRYHVESDGDYVVDELHLIHPIRDI